MIKFFVFLRLWQKLLDVPKWDLDFHKKDLQDELEEYKEAVGFINRWSEASDVVYTWTRAKYWSKVEIGSFPLSTLTLLWGMTYMYPKYTLRWLFFRSVGKEMNIKVNEVRNPRKVKKLENLARLNNADPKDFVRIATRKLERWLLLP
jgi:hypothetical protein